MREASAAEQIAPFATPSDSVHVRALRLVDFRNYGDIDLALDAAHVVLVGENGAGKTNLMEAVSLLSPGRGLRRATIEDMGRKTGAGGWSVSVRLDGPTGETRIGVGASGEAGETRAKTIRIDSQPVRAAEDLIDYLHILWLTPTMDGLFTGPASERRRFLDRFVLALDPGHAARVAAFERTMRGRNKLLEDDRFDDDWLAAIEMQMAEIGVAVASARVEAVACLARLIAATRDDAAPFPHADLALEGEIEAMAAAGGPSAEIEDRYRSMLSAARRRDKAAGRTLDGPHRADLIVDHGPKAMPAAHSSTGEQKALLLGLVLAHARLVAETHGRAPILLLDEVSAHLDQRRRTSLFDRLNELGGQCWLTGTDLAAFEPLGRAAQRLEVSAGTVRRLD
jgi:DNA replication and repair protein RecF